MSSISTGDSTHAGVVKTLLLSDFVESTKLTEALGDARSSKVFARSDQIARELLQRFHGIEIDKTDGFLFLFGRPIEAVCYALAYHDALLDLSRELDVSLVARVGIHLGEVVLRENEPEVVKVGAKPIELDGLAKPTAARIMSLARGGQTLMTKAAFDLARRAAIGRKRFPEDVVWMEHGPYRFKGISDALSVCEAGRLNRAVLAPPSNTEKAVRDVAPGDEQTLGWRPAVDLPVPGREGWILEKSIGAGGFGEVWLARQRLTKDVRAFKFCFRADRLRTLKRELTLFRLMKGVLGERPDIVRLYDVQLDDAPYFLEMEYTEGGSLAEWSGGAKNLATVPLNQRLALVAQVADALAAAHSVGVIHKDIKPSNVLIREDKEGAIHAQLCDFGIGELVTTEFLREAGVTATGFDKRATEMTDLGSQSGTRMYMAPELLAGRPPTIQSDIYALGVMLFQMVLADLERSIAHGWEGEIEDELLREDISACIVGEQTDRLPSADLLARRLRALDQRRTEREANRQAAARRARRKRRAKMAVSVSVMMIPIAVASAVLWKTAEADKRGRLARSNNLTALSFIDAHRKLADARSLLNEAIDLCPDFGPAYYSRGLLSAIEGQDASLEEKDGFAKRALGDLRTAHSLAGGNWEGIDLLPEIDTKSSSPGSQQALFLAARMFRARGHLTDAAAIYAKLPYLDVVAPLAFDERRTGLHSDKLNDKSPDQAHTKPNLDAAIVRALRPPVGDLGPMVASGYAERVAELLYDSLVVVGHDGKYKRNDALVETVVSSPDKPVTTVVLKPGLTWHNGLPLDAEDVAFSWRKQKPSKKQSMEDVRVVDSQRIEFYHARSIFEPKSDLLFPLVSRRFFEQLARENPGADDNELHALYGGFVGNGPYRLVSKTDEEIVLTRWDDYDGAHPYIKEVTFLILRNSQERAAALAAKQVDYVELDPFEFQWFASGESFDWSIIKGVVEDVWSYDFISWNNSRPPFDDRRVRRAMTMGINVERLIESHGSFNKSCVGPYHPNSWAVNKEIEALSFDPETSRQLLDDAGWHMGTDNVRVKNGEPFDFEVLVSEESHRKQEDMLVVVADLKNLGVKMRVQVLPFREIRDRAKNGDFDAIAQGVVDLGDPDRPRRRWITDGEMNKNKYRNTKVDELFDQARHEMDLVARKKLYQKIHRIIYDDQPYTFLWWRPTLLGLNQRLRGIKSGYRGVVGFHPGPRAWWVAKGEK